MLSIFFNSSDGMTLIKKKGDSRVTLEGEINAGDLERWIIPAFKNEKNKEIYLNSAGGDVEESMKIGRFLKKNEFRVYVYGNCFSSCVLLLAGGVYRHDWYPNNKVGIHRPYFGTLDKSLSSTQIKSLRDKINADLRRYFDEMDINPNLLEEMNSYSPESMKILTREELKLFRLTENDANYEEKQIALLAYVNNMSSANYRVKSKIVNDKCRHLNGDDERACFAISMYGISSQEYDERKKKFDLCKSVTPGDCWRKHIARGEK